MWMRFALIRNGVIRFCFGGSRKCARHECEKRFCAATRTRERPWDAGATRLHSEACNPKVNRSNCGEIARLVAGDYLELLHSAAVDRLTHIDVAFGVHRHCVRVYEFANLVARTAKAAENTSAGAV